MHLSIPFPTFNEKDNFSLVAVQCVLNHFHGKHFPMNVLTTLLNQQPGKWVYTSQLVSILWELGLTVKLFSREPIDPFLRTPEFAKEHILKIYGADAPIILAKNDLPRVVEATKRLAQYDIFEHHQLQFGDVENYLKQSIVPLVMVDENIINGTPGSYLGLLVVMTGFDEDNVYFHYLHAKHPVPNRKVPKAVFIHAWEAEPTDGDVVIVFGKRDPKTLLNQESAQVLL